MNTLLALLFKDLSLYQPSVLYSSPNSKIFYLFSALIRSRDFRLNFLIRLQSSGLPVFSRLSHSLIFYLYGSTIDPRSILTGPIRFVHARNIVIGRHVTISGPYALIFHNVTLGKLHPGTNSLPDSMPTFLGGVVIGASSTILGGVTVSERVVFGANSFCSLPFVPPSSTIVSHNRIVNHVYYDPEPSPFFNPIF